MGTRFQRPGLQFYDLQHDSLTTHQISRGKSCVRYLYRYGRGNVSMPLLLNWPGQYDFVLKKCSFNFSEQCIINKQGSDETNNENWASKEDGEPTKAANERTEGKQLLK